MRFSTLAVAASAGIAYAQDSASICDKYTTALLTNNTAANQYALVTLLVKTAVLGNFTGNGTDNADLPGSLVTVPGILATGDVDGTEVNLKPYFDGTLASTNVNGMPGSVNFLDGGSSTDPFALGSDGSNQYTLLSHLVSYFGVLLGCSEYGNDGFEAYGGSNNQYNVHKYMALSEAEFTYFISQVGLSAQSFGASSDDISTAAMALNGLFGQRCAMAVSVVPDTDAEPQVICIGDNCPLATASVMSGCSGDAAINGFTATEPMTATATGSGDMTSATDMTMTSATDMTMTMTDTMSMPTGTGSMSPSESATDDGNAGPRQTAAAGVAVAAGLFAVAML